MRTLLVVGLLLVSSASWAWDRRETDVYCTRTAGSTALCAPGDQPTGGGGKCPGDPATLNTSRPTTVNGVKGWRATCLDTSGRHVDTLATDVCCLHVTCVFGDEKTCDDPQ